MMFKKEKFKKIIFLLLFFCFLITPLVVAIPNDNNKLITVKVVSVNASFEVINNQLNVVATEVGLKVSQTNLMTISMNVIKFVLLFLGVISIIMIVVGGLMWMTSGGSEEKAKKARGILVNAIIGLFIVLAAYVITQWIINALTANILV